MQDRRWNFARTATASGFLVLAVFFAAPSAPAQAPQAPIQDNSFLVEEAYNQEHGVVQTAFTYQRVAGSPGYASSVTQEWPTPGQRHQLSLTVPVQGVSSATGVAQGLGDVALNYRLQLVGDLQVVPGVAVPIGVGPSRGKTGLFFYLSIELPLFGARA